MASVTFQPASWIFPIFPTDFYPVVLNAYIGRDEFRVSLNRLNVAIIEGWISINFRLFTFIFAHLAYVFMIVPSLYSSALATICSRAPCCNFCGA